MRAGSPPPPLQVYMPMLSVSQLSVTAGGSRTEEVSPRLRDSSPGRMMAAEGGGGGALDETDRPPESKGTPVTRDELLNSTHKFLGHINRTLQQLDGGRRVGATQGLLFCCRDIRPDSESFRRQFEHVY